MSDKAAYRWLWDYLAPVWFFITVYPGAIVGMVYVNPILFENNRNWRIFNEILMAYGIFMMTMTWFLTRFTNTKVPKDYQPSPGKETDTEWCPVCDKNQPPRSHHCGLCHACILKHDHHCFFTNCCIGERNQRYFVVFTFWISVGSLYSGFIGILYVFSSIWPPIRWYSYVFPVALCKFLLGRLDKLQFFVVFLLNSGPAGIMLAVFLFGAQVSLIFTGLRWHEWKKGLKSPVGHLPKEVLLRTTFGKWWFLQFFLPIGPFIDLRADEIQIKHFEKNL